MGAEEFKRRLTAILSADVEDYSRLMGEDEDATIRTLTSYREEMSALIQKHRGRVVDSPGDNLLAEFLSVVDAVRCAVEIQEELRVRNAELPENRRMHFRIGINLGDVVEEGERIYGDGVNITARVEGLAEGGGICISGTVYDSIKNKLSLNYESIGEHTVKNIKEPIRVYRMRIGPEAEAPGLREEKDGLRRWQRAGLVAVAVLFVVAGAWAIWNFCFRPPPIEPASVEKMAFPLPEKPSIAVLPFDNMSGDPDQEYLADGISENIITALSHIPEMFVIARNSTFTYKGKPVKIQQVSEELGVRYVLEGSIRTSGDQIRVTAQLIDATTGHHLWSERYDRDLKELFALQDEITLRILRALQVKLTEGEQARLWSTTDNLEAWSKLIKGSSLFEQYTKQNNARAQQLFEQAAKLDPNWDIAWTMLAWTHWFEARFGWSESATESTKRAVEIAQKAAAINPNLPEVHSLQSNIYLLQGDYEKAVIEGKKAIALGPNSAICHVLLAYTKICVGKFEEAIGLAEKAIRLSPYSPPWFLLVLDDAYRMAGRYEEALAAGKQYLERCQREQCNPFPAHLGLAATYVGLGQIKEARAHVAQLLKIDPDFSLDNARKMVSFKDPAHLERALDALRKAGLPETPPLSLPDKPSIAVLPFVNMSGDPEQEYFSDGITEEIITAQSKTPKLFVIARTSSFKYKGKEVDVRTVGRELGVRHVLEGSVRKAGDKVRITAQLVDAKRGNHLWAERYDRGLKDIFALQDEITFKVIAALQVKLTDGEQALITAWGTDKFEAYAKFLQGLEYARRFNAEGNLLARKMAEEVIALDPGYPQGYRLLGGTHMMDVWYGLSKSPGKSLAEAVRLYQKAIAMYPSAAVTCGLLGIVYTMMRQHEKGIAELEKAIALNPNAADNHAWFGFLLHLNGRHKEALVEIKKAIRLNPFPRSFYFMYLGNAYMYERMYDESIAAYKKALRVQPNNLFPHLRLAAVYSLLDREQEARAAAAEVLKIAPKFSLERFAKTIPFKNQADTEYLIKALRKVGLK